MKTLFVQGVSNVAKLLNEARAIENRSAAEAGWLLVTGEPGFGKTKTLQWLFMQLRGERRVAFVRAKATWTPRRMLMDLAVALNIPPEQRVERLFEAIAKELGENNGLIMVDEGDHAARDIRTLETLRDLTDTLFCPLILGAHHGFHAAMRRFPQIHSRIGAVVEFGPATEADVQIICSELSNVAIAPDVAARILSETRGSLRLIKGAIGRIEAKFKNSRDAITLEKLGNTPLLSASAPRALVAAHG